MQKPNQQIRKQKGAALILLMFIIGLGVLTYLLNAFDPARLKLEQDKKTMQSLNEAKQALIAWAVSHQYTPGQMPWPDRHLDPLIYDGSSDCVTTVFQYSYLLGQLSSQPDTSPCLDPNTGLNVYPALSTYPSLGQEFRDGQGNRLWYAVSRNLVRDHATSTNPVINPNIINVPTYPWLEVLDRNGNLVSSRVAAVILAPGEALDGQNRAGAADANQFLDRFQIGAAVFNNRGYATADEDFVMGDDSRNVSANDPTFVQPYNFNDKLVYITIDELMAALEKRAGEQARASLKAYQEANGYYPYAAQLGTNLMYNGTQSLLNGFLPANPQKCSYNASPLSVPILSTRISGSVNLTTLASFAAVSMNWTVVGTGVALGTTVSTVTNANQLVLSNAATSSGTANLTFTQPKMECTQPLFDAATTAISSITQVRFYLPSGTFASSLGDCTRQSSNTRCYCAGVGSCTNAATTFSCNLSSCNVVGTGATGDIRIRGGKLTSSSGGCVITTPITRNAATNCPITTTSRITCNSTNGQFSSHANGDVSLDTFLPNWFNQNQWGNYFYYELTRPASATISVGNKTSEVSVISIGRAINSAPFAASRSAIQVRPSCNAVGLNNYLDSAENVSVNVPNSIYDATSTLRSLNYNDQNFVVAP